MLQELFCGLLINMAQVGCGVCWDIFGRERLCLSARVGTVMSARFTWDSATTRRWSCKLSSFHLLKGLFLHVLRDMKLSFYHLALFVCLHSSYIPPPFFKYMFWQCFGASFNLVREWVNLGIVQEIIKCCYPRDGTRSSSCMQSMHSDC